MPKRAAGRLAAAATALLFVWAAALAPEPARAQDGPRPAEGPSQCGVGAVAEAGASAVRLVRYDGVLAADEVAVTYVGHSTFLIQTPDGLEIATDFADWLPPGFAPELVTMNGGHDSHYTDTPPDAVEIVLRGWSAAAGPAWFDIEHRGARVRNVTTDVVRGPEAVEAAANSIFIFEIGDLCLAHLGHLHMIPSPDQITEIGQIDILFAPVDGGPYMLDGLSMLEVATRLDARVVIPMHYFDAGTLNGFVRSMDGGFAARWADSPTIVFSRATLPATPELLILPAMTP